MAIKVKWCDVALGKTTTRYTAGDDYVNEISVDQATMGVTVAMTDGTSKVHVGCPYVLCLEEVPDIVVPDIEIAS